MLKIDKDKVGSLSIAARTQLKNTLKDTVGADLDAVLTSTPPRVAMTVTQWEAFRGLVDAVLIGTVQYAPASGSADLSARAAGAAVTVGTTGTAVVVLTREELAAFIKGRPSGARFRALIVWRSDGVEQDIDLEVVDAAKDGSASVRMVVPGGGTPEDKWAWPPPDREFVVRELRAANEVNTARLRALASMGRRPSAYDPDTWEPALRAGPASQEMRTLAQTLMVELGIPGENGLWLAGRVTPVSRMDHHSERIFIGESLQLALLAGAPMGVTERRLASLCIHRLTRLSLWEILDDEGKAIFEASSATDAALEALVGDLRTNHRKKK